MIQLRPVAESDLTLIHGFRLELFAADPSAVREKADSGSLLKLQSNPQLGAAYLIELDAKVCGYVVISWCFSIEFGGTFGLLDELFLVPSARGQGIGGEVIRQIELILKGRDISALRLEVEHTNVDAHRLYRRLGFEAHDRHLMTKWLGPR